MAARGMRSIDINRHKFKLGRNRFISLETSWPVRDAFVSAGAMASNATGALHMMSKLQTGDEVCQICNQSRM
jgi:hypothetical protein